MGVEKNCNMYRFFFYYLIEMNHELKNEERITNKLATYFLIKMTV